MNKEKCLPLYSKQEFLNPDESPSTGFVAAFMGYFLEDSKKPTEKDLAMWLRLGDCHQNISLHKCDFDSPEDFLEKMKKLRDFIDKFIKGIEENGKAYNIF